MTHGHLCDDDDNYGCDAAEDEPDCTHEDGHRWTSRGCGGLKENPGVWSLGGTTFLFKARCVLCGCERVETNYGSQRNPEQCDTVRYTVGEYEPDADEVRAANRRVSARARYARRKQVGAMWVAAFSPLAATL